ncbi:hypothetical protein J2W14_003989 [Pseudarthrobacter oxydans]|nr:hypothetical protein [Pseudarthrobacter oxydans]
MIFPIKRERIDLFLPISAYGPVLPGRAVAFVLDF